MCIVKVVYFYGMDWIDYEKVAEIANCPAYHFL